MSSPVFANAVIAGTEKSATTSVFDWLTAHPEVCGSSRKETNFFLDGYTGDPDVDARRYSEFFGHCRRAVPIRLEASPVYLGEASVVAPRMRMLAPDMKVVLILRDPVARLYSFYNFYRGKLHLPKGISFDDYLDRCFQYDERLKSARDLGFDEWYLKALRFGCYAEFIATLCAEVGLRQMKIMFFESLRRDDHAFMTELSEFLGIDAGFWAEFEFRRSNVTFFARNRSLHRLATRTNLVMEPVMRRYPGLKKTVVRAYKAINQEREGYDPMPVRTRERLVEFYRPSIDSLREHLGVELPEEWYHRPADIRPA